MSSEKELKEQIKFLEAELMRYRLEVQKTNMALEEVLVTLAAETKLIQKIQKLLSPTTVPSIPGIEFSSKFIAGEDSGGDYFDFFELEDKMRFAIVVASGSGYGVSALFLSLLMKHSSQIEAKKGLAPEKVLELIAKELVPEMSLKDSASLFYCIVDRRTFEMKYVLAGEMGVWWLPQSGSGPVLLQPSCPPLTRSFQSEFLSAKFTMNPKDRFVVCTEGIMLAKNQGSSAFKDVLVQNTFATAPKSGVHELRNEILFQCQKFTGRSTPSRDQTVIVTEVKDQVIRLAKK